MRNMHAHAANCFLILARLKVSGRRVSIVDGLLGLCTCAAIVGMRSVLLL